MRDDVVFLFISSFLKSFGSLFSSYWLFLLV